MTGVENLSIAVTPEFAADPSRLVNTRRPARWSAMRCRRGSRLGKSVRRCWANCGGCGVRASRAAPPRPLTPTTSSAVVASDW